MLFSVQFFLLVHAVQFIELKVEKIPTFGSVVPWFSWSFPVLRVRVWVRADRTAVDTTQ